MEKRILAKWGTWLGGWVGRSAAGEEQLTDDQ